MPPVWHDAACLRPFLAESLLVAYGLGALSSEPEEQHGSGAPRKHLAMGAGPGQ